MRNKENPGFADRFKNTSIEFGKRAMILVGAVLLTIAAFNEWLLPLSLNMASGAIQVN